MKKVIYLSLSLSLLTILASCGAADTTSEKKDTDQNKTSKVINPFVTFGGTITNGGAGELVISNMNGFSKTIKVDENGNFKDTLKITEENADYSFSFEGQYAPLFLKNGYDLNVTLDLNDFDKSLKYQGSGSAENGFLISKYLREEQEMDFMGLIDAGNDNFDADLITEFDEMLAYLENAGELDEDFVKLEKLQYESFKEQATIYYGDAVTKAAVLKELVDKPSPDFTAYTTPDGGTKSLADLTASGKYIYIDVWATWCGPCKAEIPFIKEMIANYEGKNIQVVSLSVDEEDAKDKWIKMVADKEMTWQQIRADKAWASDFIQAYAINSIPRFILLDPNGVVVDPNAPRPSSDKLTELLNSLEI
ncbi:MAG: thiol-disulfide isomerase/thioredoxin [Flavobacteriales bacterium]|jgi:thiol-disulfide isomerase/thioredoxin